MEEDFSREFPRLAKYEDLFKLWFELECHLRGINPVHKKLPSDPCNMACYDVAEWIMAPAFILLNSFAAVVMPGHVPVHKPGHYGVYDPHLDRTSKSNREKFIEDKILLLKRLPEFCTIAQYENSKVPAEDELTRGLRVMMHTKQIPLWLAFVAQCTSTFTISTERKLVQDSRNFTALQRKPNRP
jgi:hypothetical protein